MRRERGAVLLTGKLEGAEDMVMALEEDDGVCWTRQVEMLFTALELARNASDGIIGLLRTTL